MVSGMIRHFDCGKGGIEGHGIHSIIHRKAYFSAMDLHYYSLSWKEAQYKKSVFHFLKLRRVLSAEMLLKILRFIQGLVPLLPYVLSADLPVAPPWANDTAVGLILVLRPHYAAIETHRFPDAYTGERSRFLPSVSVGLK